VSKVNKGKVIKIDKVQLLESSVASHKFGHYPVTNSFSLLVEVLGLCVMFRHCFDILAILKLSTSTSQKNFLPKISERV
jgi:hypothetical protein